MSDDKILKAMRELRRKGLRSVPADMICLQTGFSKQKVHTRLNNLSRYGFVKKTGRKQVNYWDVTE